MKRLSLAVLATGVALAAAALVAAPASAAVATAAPADHSIAVLQPPPGPGQNCYWRQASVWGGYAQWRTCRDRGSVTVQGFVQDTQ